MDLSMCKVFICFSFRGDIPDRHHRDAALDGEGQFNQILGGLVVKPQGNITLVPDSDKREAIQQISAEEDFQD